MIPFDEQFILNKLILLPDLDFDEIVFLLEMTVNSFIKLCNNLLLLYWGLNSRLLLAFYTCFKSEYIFYALLSRYERLEQLKIFSNG